MFGGCCSFGKYRNIKSSTCGYAQGKEMSGHCFVDSLKYFSHLYLQQKLLLHNYMTRVTNNLATVSRATNSLTTFSKALNAKQA